MLTKAWFYAAGIRAIKTFAQAALSVLIVSEISETTGITEVNWLAVVSIGLMAAAISLLTSLKGLPEVSGDDGTLSINTEDPTKDVYSLELNDSLEALTSKASVTFKVVK